LGSKSFASFCLLAICCDRIAAKESSSPKKQASSVVAGVVVVKESASSVTATNLRESKQMQLSVQLLEARNLTVQRHRPHLSHSGGRHARCPPRAYAIIKVGSSACKSSISASTHPSSPNSSAIEAPRDGSPPPYKGFRLHSNPYLADFAWFQEFIFELADGDDLAAEIQISVWNLHDRFSGADTFLGRFHVPVSMVRNGVNRGMANIPPAWYPLQKCHGKGSAGTPVTGMWSNPNSNCFNVSKLLFRIPGFFHIMCDDVAFSHPSFRMCMLLAYVLLSHWDAVCTHNLFHVPDCSQCY
jgi:hypothetical protein